MATAMFERRSEVGLMKALGARRITLAAIFLSESFLLALIGGLSGFGAGAWLAAEFGRQIFGSPTNIEPVVVILIVGLASVVTFLGSAMAIRRAIETDAVLALRGEL
jgi:putative ABC transport system permease protein